MNLSKRGIYVDKNIKLIEGKFTFINLGDYVKLNMAVGILFVETALTPSLLMKKRMVLEK